MMKWKICHTVSAGVALAVVLLAGQAQAACSGGQRTSHHDADCLDADWSNRSVPIRGKATVQNKCSDIGTVVAKIDRIAGSDWTWHLTIGEERSKSSGYKIRGIYCCKDLSEICDTSELSDVECAKRYRSSPADDTCQWPTAGYESPKYCKIEATCETGNGLVRTSITVDYADTDDLRNCDGTLQVDEC